MKLGCITAQDVPARACRERVRLAAASVFVLLACLFGLPAAAEVQQIALVVKDGKLVSGPKVVRLKRDDQVNLSITSDRADEVHVHGYDLQAKLAANQTTSLEFVAKRTGRFAIELHKSNVELSVLEIYPK